MKFYPYTTMRQMCKQLLHEDMTDEQMIRLVYSVERPAHLDRSASNEVGRIYSESAWRQEKCPFYEVYPVIQDALIQVDLSKITGDMVRPILPHLAVQLAEGHAIADGPGAVSAFLVSEVYATERTCKVQWAHAEDGARIGLALHVCYAPGTEDQARGDIGFFTFPLTPGQSIEKTLAEMPRTYRSEDERAWNEVVMMRCLRLYIALTFIAEGDDLLERIVLAKDRAAYERHPDDPKYVERAARRGRFGWTVGANLPTEISPHFRRPHFAIRWTGKGRAIPLLRPIKGSIVHRDKMANVPTGYHEKEEKE